MPLTKTVLAPQWLEHFTMNNPKKYLKKEEYVDDSIIQIRQEQYDEKII